MRVLVTGAAGFFGAHLTAAIARRDVVAAVLATDIAPAPDADISRAWSAAGAPVEYRRLDVTDRAAVRAAIAAFGPDAVVHAAAVTPTAAQEAEEARHIARVNAEGTFTLLDVVTALPGLCRVVLISSGAVFGNPPPAAPIAEDAPPAPVSLYAATKVAAENIALRLGRLRGVETVVARLASVYGGFERATPSRPTTSHVHRLATAPRPVQVAGGGIVRDFVHADDAADAVAALLDAPLDGTSLVHVGGGEPVSWERLVAAFRAAGVEVREGPPEEAAVAVRPADARPVFALGRLQGLIGYGPRTIEDGVRGLLRGGAA